MRVLWDGPVRTNRWYRIVDQRELSHIRSLQQNNGQYLPRSFSGPYPHRVKFTNGRDFSLPVEGQYLVNPRGGVVSIKMESAPDRGADNTGIRPIPPEVEDGTTLPLRSDSWGELNREGILADILRIETTFPRNIRPGKCAFETVEESHILNLFGR